MLEQRPEKPLIEQRTSALKKTSASKLNR